MILKFFMCQNNLKYIQFLNWSFILKTHKKLNFKIKSSFRLFYFHLGSFASILVSIWVHLGKSTQRFPALWRHAIDKSYRGKGRENSDVSIREHRQLTDKYSWHRIIGRYITLYHGLFKEHFVNRHREITSSETNAKSESLIITIL